MQVRSKALEVNIADYHVDVTIDEKYMPLQDILSQYYGLQEGLNSFLTELSHPYRNLHYIVQEARTYGLDYIHLLLKHPRGDEGVGLFCDIFLNVFESSRDLAVRTDAADNLLLFLQRVVNDSGNAIGRFVHVLNAAFERIVKYADADFFLFIKSYYQIRKLARIFLERTADAKSDYRPICALMIRYLRCSYDYWFEKIEDPRRWFEREIGENQEPKAPAGIFEPVSHERIARWRQRLSETARNRGIGDRQKLQRLLELPAYGEIIDTYRRIPQQLLKADQTGKWGHHWKAIFLSHIMNISGLSMMHEEVLRDINRTMSWLIEHENYRDVMHLIRKTVSILKTSVQQYPEAALQCVLNMGRGIYKTDDSDLVNYFIDAVIDLGFQTPMLGGVGDDWQVKANSAHVQNIRIWLELIELNPRWSIRLMSALVVYLSLCGVFIKDTDLFPRDVTRFLNSDISKVYNLAKQLLRLFPVFFNDIGAEGELRDISTRLDEITQRKDVLIHFLRKQSHVESSNQILHFMEAVLVFWHSRRKEIVQPFVPPKIYVQILSRGTYIDGVHRLMKQLEEKGIDLPRGLLNVSAATVKAHLCAAETSDDIDVQRVELIIAFYKLLHQKYHFDVDGLNRFLTQLQVGAFPDLAKLKKALDCSSPKKKAAGLLDYLECLKSLILSEQQYEIREDIYKKRHITVDIPSMYGSYHEMKFDAMGLTFRIESLVNVLLEELVEDIDLSLVTKATFYQIYDRLILFNRALKVDGMRTTELEHQLEPLSHSLEVRGFTYTQYLDIFKNFALAVKNIVNDHFNTIYENKLDRVLAVLPQEQLLEKFRFTEDADRASGALRVSEIFSRDRIATSLGLQQLDRFLTRILNTLFRQAEKLPENRLHMLLLYDPQRAMTPIDHPYHKVSGLIHLGNKGYNLVRLKKLGLPVPPGFIITTEVFRCREVINGYWPAGMNFREQLNAQIELLERTTGKKFGDPRNPLLFSVRSGSAISQPGMMDTFLNVGINDDITAGLAARSKNPWFAWDNYRRFLQCYGMAMGMERDHFDAIIRASKVRAGIPLKRSFTGEQMKAVALAYKQSLLDAGINLPENPIKQLHAVIKMVLSSWDSEKAKAYRKIIGISDDWGTAVTVQVMVYGNISRRSGSGVIFTHNPRWSGEALRLWGDFTIGNQGEDVVAGLVSTLPISMMQQEIEMRDTDITLETHFPQIYAAMKKWAVELIDGHGWSPQEMEFTFQGDTVQDLYLLQTRDMVIRQRKKAPTFDPEQVACRKPLSHGIGVSGGAMAGRVVFDLQEIEKWRRDDPDTSLILVRSDTVPDDIREIFAADGLLTAKGGLTSHAAVVAHRLGKTCVVGCENMDCDEKQKRCVFNQFVIQPGDPISIDGYSGAVYQGLLKV